MAQITIKRGNWSFKDPDDDIPTGSIIDGGNFSQLVPGTVILEGKKLTINGGNWINVKQDANWIITGGNWAQIERCSHKHPEWTDIGLKKCPQNCKHQSATQEWQEIDVIEFKEVKNVLSTNEVKIEEIEDDDGVKTQLFKKKVYVYADNVVRGDQ